MEDPSSQNFVATICFVVYLDSAKCFFSATEMAAISINCKWDNKKGRRRQTLYIVC